MHQPAAAPVTVSRAALDRIPGPRGTALVGALRDLVRRPNDFLLELALRYGGVVCVPFPLETFILVSDADVIQHIFHQNHANYTKQTGRFRSLAEIMGYGLFTSDGDIWRRQRQRVQPAFHQDRLAAFERVVNVEVAAAIDEWRGLAANRTPVVLNHDMLRLSLLIIVKAMFGADIRGVLEPALEAFSRSHQFINPVSFVNLVDPPRRFKRIAPGFRAFERSLAVLHRVIQQIVDQRMREGSDKGDLLSMLIASRDEEAGEAMKAPEVRDEVMTMFMAGHETVALGLTWTFYLLSTHPTIRAGLQEEVDRVLGGRPPALQDLPRLNLTRMVIDEAMRLYPPGWAVDRRAERNDVLGGYEIPAGATVGISMYVVHRLPRYWTNPQGFDPWRFSPERSAGRPQYAYFPFGGGPRRCIGMRFALVQMQLMVAHLMHHFELDLLPGPPIAPKARLNFSPSRDIVVTVRPRVRPAVPSA
jgi:cytochrome P450